MIHYVDDFVWNCDQTGYRKELHGGRSLAFEGEKHVEKLAVLQHSLSHSYTAQYTITKSGKQLSPALVILQEEKGEFGPRVFLTFLTKIF